ncbi:MAG TPA: type II secretion system F family protein [Mycobacteriales bacterium]|nr:type II secretion system F family protein [Mycobacteriales bacterium]
MIAVALVLLGIGVAVVGVGAAQARGARRRRVAEALDLQLATDVRPTQALALTLERTLAWADRRSQGTPWNERMLVKLERARVSLRPAEYVALWCASAVVGALLGALLGGVPAAAVLGLLGAAAPPLVVARRTTTRRRAFEAQLPDVLDLAASSMEAGHSLLTALQLVAEDAAEPMGPEIQRVLAETEVGRPLLEALDALARRLDLRDLDWTVEGIRIQEEVGGRLSEMLRTLAGFMRAREEVRRELRALTAEGKLSAYVLGLLPILMLLFMVLSAKSYVQPLFTMGSGRILLGVMALLIGGSALVMRKMIDVEV